MAIHALTRKGVLGLPSSGKPELDKALVRGYVREGGSTAIMERAESDPQNEHLRKDKSDKENVKAIDISE